MGYTTDWGSSKNGCKVGFYYDTTLEYNADRSQARIHDWDIKFYSADPIWDTSNDLSVSGGAITNNSWNNPFNKSSSWSGTMTLKTSSGEWQDLWYGETHTATASESLSGISYAGGTLSNTVTITYPARAYSLPLAGSTPTITAATANSATISFSFPLETLSDEAYPVDTGTLQCSTDGVNWWNQYTATITYLQATVYTHVGLTPGTQYYYRTFGTNSSGNGAYSPTSAGVWTAPAAPTMGSVSRTSDTSHTVNWTNNASGRASASYNGTGILSTNYVAVAGGAALEVGVSDMNAGELSRYYVYTLNDVGYSAGTLSPSVYSPTAPSAPATVTLGAFTSAAGKSSATLSWTATSDTTSYTVAVVNGTGIIGAVSGTSVTITDIDPGELTRFSVASVNATGTSAATMSQAGIYAPTVADAPTTVAVSYNATTAVISISWAAPADNGGTPLTNYQYQIETQANAGTDPWVVSTPYTNAGLVTAVSFAQPWAFNFRVSVRAVNAIGNSVAGLDETGVIGGYVKVWDGSAWQNEFLYVFVSDWSKTALVRKYDGAAWAPLT